MDNIKTNSQYQQFLDRRRQVGGMSGFNPIWMPSFLFDFQRHLVEWAIRKGRAAIFADCGLGKTPMQLVWSENVVRKSGKPVLILTPLAVASQIQREATTKFQVDAAISRNGKHSSRIVLANYERLHYFNPEDFGGIACDESSILKNFDGKTKAAITEFARTLSYRLLTTATAAPNDVIELGTSSEALGYLGYVDMITRFFKEDIIKDYLGWGRKQYRFRGHAEVPFWRWVCSWARACRRPSDLGFDDGRFMLPALIEREHTVSTSRKMPGFLFALPARELSEQRAERRHTLKERCESAAQLVNRNESCVLWCHLNDEGDLLEDLIPGCVQVSGADSDDAKEEKLLAFSLGQVRHLVTKQTIAGWGLNWQHCSHMTTFPSHSFEAYYQSVRRCWRFGQERNVIVDIISTQGEQAVLRNLQRKAAAADRMFTALTLEMNRALHIDEDKSFIIEEEIPVWLSLTK